MAESEMAQFLADVAREIGERPCVKAQRWRDEQWFNNYSWGQHLEKDEVNRHGQD